MAVWHPQLSQWGCDACRQMLPPPPQQPPPMQHPPQYYQPPPQQPVTPPCPQCRGPSTWYPAANTFGCDRCQIPVASPVPMQQGNDAGAIILKVVIFIVVIILCVAIRVGVKAAMR